MPTFEFGEWLPDLGYVDLPGLKDVRNVYPTANGWHMFPTDLFGQTTNGIQNAALQAQCVGAKSGRLLDGTSYIIAGTTAGKIELSRNGSAFVVDAGSFTVPPLGRFVFEQYGVYLLVTNGIEPPNYEDATAGTPAMASIGADVSLGQVSEIVEDFYVLGNITGRGANVGIGRQEAGIHWSARGNPLGWPAVGTQAARDVLSDFNIFPGDGGPVTAIVAAEEYALVFRRRQTWRMDYVGLPDIFRFRLIDAARGCIVEEGAVAAGNNVFYPSEAGFLRCDGANVYPIGAEKVDVHWRQSFNREFLNKVVGVHYPQLRLVMWTLPSGPSFFQLIFGYQYDTQKWTKVVPTNLGEWLLLVVSPNTGSLDLAPYANMNLDTDVLIKDVNLDTLGVSEPQTELALFNSSHRITIFRDETRPLILGFIPWSSRIITGDYRDPNDARLKLRSIRPHFARHDGVTGFTTDETGCSILVRSSNVRNKQTWKPEADEAAAVNALGLTPVRAHGRYIEAAFFIYGAVGLIQGFEAKVSAGGAR